MVGFLVDGHILFIYLFKLLTFFYLVCNYLVCKYYAFIFLLLLIRNRHLEIVQFLVSGNHCQANAVNINGYTALHYAAR